jgi:hypothetical protein
MNTPTQRVYQIKLPMRFRTSRKKVTALNLNVYRNLHFRSLTALKHKFQDHGKKLLRDAKVPPLGRIQLRYQVFTKTKREFDIANICSIVDKFFSDTLQHAGIIEDDNWKFLDDVSFGFGGFAPEEYVLVTIIEIEPRKGNVMRILLEEQEIQEVLDQYVLNTLKMPNATGVELRMENDEFVAEVMIDGSLTAKPRKTPAKNKGGRPAGSKNKPKEEPDEDVETPGDDSDAGDGAGDPEPTEDKASAKANTKVETGNSSSKNLFGDEETESSKSDSPEETEDDSEVKTTTSKKSSIFDQ